jgi:hypothetical protein
MRSLLLSKILPYHLSTNGDLNKCLSSLLLLTTDFSETSDTLFHIEPNELLRFLSLIYYILSTRYDSEMNPQE